MDDAENDKDVNQNQNNCPACGASFVSIVLDEGCAVCTTVRRSSSGVIQTVLDLAVADASELILQRGPIASATSEKRTSCTSLSQENPEVDTNLTSSGVAIQVLDVKTSEDDDMMNHPMRTPQRLSAEINSNFSSPEQPSPGSSVEGIQRLARKMESYNAHVKNGVAPGPAVARDDVVGKAAVAATITDALSETLQCTASAIADASHAAVGKPLDAAQVHAILTLHLMPAAPNPPASAVQKGDPVGSASSEESGESVGVDSHANPMWTVERNMLLQRVVQLENESQIIARRILDQQALSAREMASLEIENESLRSYVDRLMSQLLQARMDQPTTESKSTPTAKRDGTPKSRLFSSDNRSK
eukprot:m.135619 g.135619  ORF g.135619 m.135619 type:complete len:360 (-) comp17558_c0_seq1:127-1206(-)